MKSRIMAQQMGAKKNFKKFFAHSRVSAKQDILPNGTARYGVSAGQKNFLKHGRVSAHKKKIYGTAG